MWTSIAFLIFLNRTAQDCVELQQKADAALTQRKMPEAEAFLDAAAAKLHTLGPQHAYYPNNLLSIERSYVSIGQAAKAEALLQSALQRARGEGAPQVVLILSSAKGRDLAGHGRFEEASVYIRPALEIAEKVAGPDAVEQLDSLLRIMASIEERLGHVKEAEELLLRDAKLPHQIHWLPPCAVSAPLPPGEPMPYPYSLTEFWIRHGKPELAEALYRDLVKQSSGESIASQYGALADLRWFLYRHKRTAESIELHRQQVAILLSSRLPYEQDCGHQEVASLVLEYLGSKDFPSAKRVIEEEVARTAASGPERYARSLELPVALALARNDYPEAEKAIERCRAAADKVLSKGTKFILVKQRRAVFDAYLQGAQLASARRIIDQQIDDTLHWFGKENPDYVEALGLRADVAIEQKDYEAAKQWVEKFIDAAGQIGYQGYIQKGMQQRAKLADVVK